MERARRQGEKIGEKRGEKIGEKRGERIGEKIGEERGEIRGKREQAIAIATELKKMGLSFSDIAKGTGLSIEEIEKL